MRHPRSGEPLIPTSFCRPEPVTAVPSAVQTGPRSVCIAWSGPPYDGGSKVTGYLIEMTTESSDNWQVLTDSCLCLCYTKKDLDEGQQYRFRVRALNIHGASDPSPPSLPVHIVPFDAKGEEENVLISEEESTVTVERGEQFRGDFLVAEELGKGRYGIVHKVIHRSSQRTLAAKFVKCIKKQDREKVYQEIEIMNCLKHPKLLQLTAAFESQKEIIMVMEYISGGELFERVVADDFTLTEKDCILFMRQICEGVGYMHRNNVVHLDLKPENIMCQSRTSHQIKLIDFGLAQRLRPGTSIRVLWGTPEFIPPEIINYEPIGTESDMWSVGVICYVLLSGLSPFMGDNDAETFANITRADYDFDDEAFNAISQDAKDFISSLLVKRKEKRMSAGDCLMHKWLSQEDVSMSKVALSTDKLKKFLIYRKWQKTGNAIRALGRMATAARRSSGSVATTASRNKSNRMSVLNEEESSTDRSSRVSERSDSGFSDCSSVNSPPSSLTNNLLNKKFSISEEVETELTPPPPPVKTTNCSPNKVTASPKKIIKPSSPISDKGHIQKDRKLNTSPALKKDARILGSENIQKAFAFWKR